MVNPNALAGLSTRDRRTNYRSYAAVLGIGLAMLGSVCYINTNSITKRRAEIILRSYDSDRNGRLDSFELENAAADLGLREQYERIGSLDPSDVVDAHRRKHLPE